MEERLLAKEEERDEKRSKVRWSTYVEELKKLSYMAGPMVAVTVSGYLLQLVAVMMAGHLSELSLSSVSIATSFSNVTGFSLLIGMSGGLETLCGQAYGAGQYEKLGIYTSCSVISLTLISLPVSLLWFFMENLLILMGQDPLISAEAGKYSICLIPALFAFVVLQSMIRYLQTQGLIFPMLLSSCATLIFHVPACWMLVFKTELGSVGAALAIGLSYWLNVVVLGFYIGYSSACEKTRVSFTSEVWGCFRDFFYFGVPSALMVCLEWWSFELLILLSGLLTNPQLETSVLSICLSITSLHFYVPYGVSAAASTRISNEVGAGNPLSAQVAVLAAGVLAAMESVIVSISLLCFRSVLGYAFSNEKEVVDYVKRVVPLLSISVIVDSSQAILSGVARGCGWQHLGAIVNLGAYYIVGIPVAALLGFVAHMNGIGLWIGILAGSTVQATLLALVTIFTDWQKQATKARERVGISKAENALA